MLLSADGRVLFISQEISQHIGYSQVRYHLSSAKMSHFENTGKYRVTLCTVPVNAEDKGRSPGCNGRYTSAAPAPPKVALADLVTIFTEIRC
jgi:hypothetical protein